MRVAAVQAAPAFLDLEGTLDRLEHWARRAAGEGDLAGPVYDEETVVVADCGPGDLDEIVRESLTPDVSGHCSRPDLFELRFAPRRR